jgi:hypothetical protein
MSREDILCDLCHYRHAFFRANPEAKELVEADTEAVVEEDAGWTEEQRADLLASALLKTFETE